MSDLTGKTVIYQMRRGVVESEIYNPTYKSTSLLIRYESGNTGHAPLSLVKVVDDGIADAPQPVETTTVETEVPAVEEKKTLKAGGLQNLNISKIRMDGGTQPRAAIDEDVVSDYAESIQNGATLPPPDVYFDGNEYWLADGFHRVHASKAAGKKSLKVMVHQGSLRDAILHSVGANATHGLRRTNADKRRAIERLLRDDEWALWSDSEIARRTGVSQPTVSGLRKSSLINFISENGDGSSEEQDSPSEEPVAENRTYITKHGTVSTMQTGNIGGKSKPSTKPATVAPEASISSTVDENTTTPTEPVETPSTQPFDRLAVWNEALARVRQVLYAVQGVDFDNGNDTYNQSIVIGELTHIAERIERVIETPVIEYGGVTFDEIPF